MLQKALCVLLFIGASGVAVADEFIGGITKVEDGKATVQEMKYDKKLNKPGEPVGKPVVMTLAKDAKVFHAAEGEKETPLKNGLQNKLFKELPETQATLFCRITTDDKKNITKIVVFAAVAPAK